MQHLDFEKKIIQGAYWPFTKEFKYFPGFSKDTLKKHRFCTNEIKQKSEYFVKQLRCYDQSNWTLDLTDLKKARKPKNHSSFLVKHWNVFFSFLIFSQLLAVLAPPLFSSLLSAVRNFLEVTRHVYMIPNLLLYHK